MYSLSSVRNLEKQQIYIYIHSVCFIGMSISWILIIHNIKAPRLINHGFWNGTVWLRWTGPCWRFYVCDQIAVSYNHKAVPSSQPTLNPLTAHGCILILSSPCYLDMFSSSKLSGPEMDGFLCVDLMRAKADFLRQKSLTGLTSGKQSTEPWIFPVQNSGRNACFRAIESLEPIWWVKTLLLFTP